MSILTDMNIIEKWRDGLIDMLNDPCANSDHPECPNCGSIMNFYGHDEKGDFEYGDGYWECPNCHFNMTEDDL